MQESSKGTLAAITAFSVWGVLPMFWKLMEGLPITQVTAHRVIWTFAILIPVILFRKSWAKTWTSFRHLKTVITHAVAALTLASNWMIYVWATHNDRIIEGALGYYINPFLYILLGFIFLGERHSHLQIGAIIIASAGVILQFPAINGIPWVAFGLACTFAAYGMIRKLSPLGSFSGLLMETCILLPAAITFLAVQQTRGLSAFGNDAFTTLLFCGTGIVTAIPLLCFARGARAISLSLLGILQFIGPTGQFLVGWLVYNEPLPAVRLASFGLIWIAVFLYCFSLRPGQSTPRT